MDFAPDGLSECQSRDIMGHGDGPREAIERPLRQQLVGLETLSVEIQLAWLSRGRSLQATGELIDNFRAFVPALRAT